MSQESPGASDQVRLSAAELQALARMEAGLTESDPTWTKRLTSPQRRAQQRWHRFCGLLLMLVGVTTMLITIGWSLWLALMGVSLIGVGLALTLSTMRTAHLSLARWLYRLAQYEL